MEDGPFRAVIFDMDGVLTDSEPAFYAAVNDVLARHGAYVGMEEYRPYVGVATEEVWRRLIERYSLPTTLAAIQEDYEAPLMARLHERRPPLPGARELIDALRARGVPVGLCTSSYARWADAVLASAGLGGLFDALSTADLVERTKPNPAPYRLAASMLGRPPEECVAIEDSASGVASALRAGCYVVQLRATETAAAPVDGARAIGSLGEFPLELLAARPGPFD